MRASAHNIWYKKYTTIYHAAMNGKKINRSILYVLVAMSLLLMACQSKHKTEQRQEKAIVNNDTNAIASDDESNLFQQISVPDFDRNDVSLLNEINKNKITVIDFWASWCGPCMHEMPNLIALYSNYHDQGFGIIGISLDSDYNKWKTTVETMKMPWLQLSELRGWDSYVAKQFSVSAIPYTIITNKDGVILKKGLRGEELETFVSSYLKDINKK